MEDLERRAVSEVSEYGEEKSAWFYFACGMFGAFVVYTVMYHVTYFFFNAFTLINKALNGV